MSNLDESIGEILLNLQREDPITFKKLMKKAQEENPELFDENMSEEIKNMRIIRARIDVKK